MYGLFPFASSEEILEEAAVLCGFCDGDHERELEAVLGDIMDEHES